MALVQYQQVKYIFSTSLNKNGIGETRPNWENWEKFVIKLDGLSVRKSVMKGWKMFIGEIFWNKIFCKELWRKRCTTIFILSQTVNLYHPSKQRYSKSQGIFCCGQEQPSE